LQEVIKQLHDLQELDVVIHDIKTELEGLPRRTAELDEQIREKTSELDTHRERLHTRETEKSDQEKMLFIEHEKLKRVRSRLTGTNMRNQSAYYANQREIEKMKKETDAMEASILEHMEFIENLTETIENIEAGIKDSTAARDEAAGDVERKSAVLQQDMDENFKQRSELVLKIEPTLRAQYERIQTHFPGNVVCRAIDEMCTGCHMHIPPQLYNELLQEKNIHTCPACQRILFFQAEEDVPAEATSP